MILSITLHRICISSTSCLYCLRLHIYLLLRILIMIIVILRSLWCLRLSRRWLWDPLKRLLLLLSLLCLIISWLWLILWWHPCLRLKTWSCSWWLRIIILWMHGLSLSGRSHIDLSTWGSTTVCGESARFSSFVLPLF